MAQRVVEYPTFGKNVAEQINHSLGKNPGWQVHSVHNIDVARIGGPDKHVLVIFQTVDDSVNEHFDENIAPNS